MTKVPLNESYLACCAFGCFITFISSIFGNILFWGSDEQWTANECLFAIAWIILSPFAGFIIYLVFGMQTKCPKCGQRFCIEYTDTQTITESIVKQRDSNGKMKNYRVGVEHIKWKCNNCNYKNEGEREYKRSV